ncbi:MAG: hypothetical protein ACRD3S_17650, partial [Terracidiphilus sp.]
MLIPLTQSRGALAFCFGLLVALVAIAPGAAAQQSPDTNTQSQQNQSTEEPIPAYRSPLGAASDDN